MMTSRIKTELDQDKFLLSRYRKRVSLFQVSDVFHPNFKQLEQAYCREVARLNQLYRDSLVRTSSEEAIFNKIARATKLKWYKSFWIANRNIDLFCPVVGKLYQPGVKDSSVANNSLMRGLAIEIDGSIHNRELKMRKDESKSKLLQELGIGHVVIQNCDLYEATTNNTINHLRNLSRLDTRAKCRVLRKVYHSTLVFHASDEVFTELFGAMFSKLHYDGSMKKEVELK